MSASKTLTSVTTTECQRAMQASPNDPENFPFVVLGNKVDQNEGRSRVVRPIPLHRKDGPHPTSNPLLQRHGVCAMHQAQLFRHLSRGLYWMWLFFWFFLERLLLVFPLVFFLWFF